VFNLERDTEGLYYLADARFPLVEIGVTIDRTFKVVFSLTPQHHSLHQR
jgi:hypothetical protein